MTRPSKYCFAAARLIDRVLARLPNGITATALDHDRLYASESNEARLLVYDDGDTPMLIDVVCDWNVTFTAPGEKAQYRSPQDEPDEVIGWIKAWKRGKK